MPDMNHASMSRFSDWNLQQFVNQAPEGAKREAVRMMIAYQTFVTSRLNFAVPPISQFMAAARQIVAEPMLLSNPSAWTRNRDLQMLRLEYVRWEKQIKLSFESKFNRDNPSEAGQCRGQLRLAKAIIDADVFLELVVPMDDIDFCGQSHIKELFRQREKVEISVAHGIISTLWQDERWMDIKQTYEELASKVAAIVVAYHSWRLQWTWIHFWAKGRDAHSSAQERNMCWYDALATKPDYPGDPMTDGARRRAVKERGMFAARVNGEHNLPIKRFQIVPISPVVFALEPTSANIGGSQHQKHETTASRPAPQQTASATGSIWRPSSLSHFENLRLPSLFSAPVSGRQRSRYVK
ncbi:hypothetical protein ACM66B_003240 [Microbotryomycetes sp. NB124-2]